jgi:hypothetical protein
MKTKRQTENTRFVQSVGERTPEICHGYSENRQDVWDADLCVGKRHGGSEKTMSFLTVIHQAFLAKVGSLVTSFLRNLRQRSGQVG